MLYINTFKKIIKSLVEADVTVSLWTFEECPVCGDGVVNQESYSIDSYEDLDSILSWNWEDKDANLYHLTVDKVGEDWYELNLSYPSDTQCFMCEQYELNTVHAYDYADIYESEEWAWSVFHHGVQAYNQASDPEVGFSRIEEIYDCYDMEICTSTEMIGPYGVSVYGDIQVASKCDLWSTIDPDDGTRIFNEDSLELIKDPQDLYDVNGDHNEIIITNTVIESIWCKDWVDDKTKARLKDLAKKMEVFFIETPGRH